MKHAEPDAWIDAGEASRILGVARATLYAYVSRGYVRSEPAPGDTRARRYARRDVERLRQRTEGRRDPDAAAARALDWGMPILESSITLITGDALYYRGHDAVTLARTRSIDEVASLVWTGQFEAAPPRPEERRRAAAVAPDDPLPFIARAQATLAVASTRDLQAFDLRSERVALTGRRILHLLSGIAAPADASRRTFRGEVDHRLAHAWRIGPRGADVVRAAIILCADHELNVSAFTARCVASSGSNPYAVVIAGLASLEGTRHGGSSVRVESMLQTLRRERALRDILRERLRRGEAIDGFGHPLYRHGDPRAAALLALLRDRYPRSSELAFALAVADAAGSVMREQPNIDFALAALSRVLRLPAGAPLTIFALGRTIGWIGHAIEQYQTGQIIRPRAKYVGPATLG
jgi:citrate synthase